MNKMVELPAFDEAVPDHARVYERGAQAFALLFTRWMDTNEWSHPVMTALASSAMGGIRWLHSSQISGLRHAGLNNPGPRTFYAIAELNRSLWRYKTTKRLIPGTSSSAAYENPFVITEDGEPPSAGWFYEVFCGLRVPQDIDLHEAYCTEEQANRISVQWGALIRRLMRERDLDLITDLNEVMRQHYPARDADRVRRTREVIENRYVWSPDELLLELPAIDALTKALGGPSTEDGVMQLLHTSR